MRDDRTCAACGEPIANALVGFRDSIRACDEHLRAWNASRERMDAAIASMGKGTGMLAAFDAWAAALARRRR